MESRGLIFLTGATGHTGSRLARRLAEEGWRARCLLHTPGRRAYLPDHPRIEVVEGSLTEPAGWAASAAGAAALIHAAHVGFAPRVVEACRAAGVERVIALSSTRRFTRFPEETARRVIAGEEALEHSGLAWTVLRPTMIYGGDRDNNLERLVRWLRRRRWLPRVGDGRNLVQPIFVADLVEAVMRALARPVETRGRALTLAGPEPLTQRQLIEEVAAAMGIRVRWVPVPYGLAMAAAGALELCLRRPPVTRAQLRRTLEDKAFDIDEARAALGGWQPRPFGEGIRLKLAGKA
ncbi:MAG TPA: NAD(P)H-binding protein [Candidatus Sumerlaeota bacterium]|nr:NAD(P)H-binding protein [Candidatus Sumerlaeota bacterium]